MKHTKSLVVLAALALLLTGAVTHTVAGRRPAARGQAVQIIKLRLSANGRELARLSTPNGIMATVSRQGGEAIGLTPSLEGDGVTVTVAIREPATSDFKLARRIPLSRKVPADVGTERTPLVVEWIDTVSFTPGGAAIMAPCRTCCVSCESVTICACEVITTCGSCCCSQACACQGGAA